MNHILLLEDDESLIDGLKYTLEKNGFSPDIARTTREARSLLKKNPPYDLLLLDVTLPDGTGFDLCTWVRARDSRIPIIFLTASDEELNIIRGLDSGGDDYITKPFLLGELLSRIRALLRRTGLSEPAEGLSCGDLFLDFTKSQALLKSPQRRPGPPPQSNSRRALGWKRKLRGRQHPLRLHPPPAGKNRGRSLTSLTPDYRKRYWVSVEAIRSYF